MKSILIPSLALLAVSASSQTFTYPDLINRLTDMEYLATLPQPGERTGQFSSYDRRSQYDAASGKYLAWDANDDGTGIIRIENGEEVFAEMTGPGCIWRIWSADPSGQGKVRIVLDGTEVFHDLFAKLFDSQTLGADIPQLAYVASRGWNNYLPMPYQKSCKITAEPGWGRYYHIGYTTYPAGTGLPSFSLPVAPKYLPLLEKANEQLGQAPVMPAAEKFQIASRQRMTVFKQSTPGAITSWHVKLDLPQDTAAIRKLLENLIIEMRWDNQTSPAVKAPLDAFFGTQPGVNPYASYPMGITASGLFYCRWFMPFAAAEITIINTSGQPVNLESALSLTALKRPLEQYGRFHAKWHGDDPEPLPEPERQAIDWRVLHTQGRGRWCGMMLHIWNPMGSWWGEGDEKFYVDGESFPSTFGTGSEDYFGYAWGNPKLFMKPYHIQTISDNNAGHISVGRFHITDQIPFQTSFEGDIEKYYANKRPTLYWSTAYWYLDVTGKDPYTAALSTPEYIQPEIPLVKGAMECEKMPVLHCSPGSASHQDMRAFLPPFDDKPAYSWSNMAQLFWHGGQIGGKLTLSLPVAKSGKYHLIVMFTKARDYGNLQLWLDGKKIGGAFNGYSPKVIPSGEMDFGEVELSAGNHEICFEIVGKDDRSSNYYAGFDYLLLK